MEDNQRRSLESARPMAAARTFCDDDVELLRVTLTRIAEKYPDDTWITQFVWLGITVVGFLNGRILEISSGEKHHG